MSLSYLGEKKHTHKTRVSLFADNRNLMVETTGLSETLELIAQGTVQ